MKEACDNNYAECVVNMDLDNAIKYFKMDLEDSLRSEIEAEIREEYEDYGN